VRGTPIGSGWCLPISARVTDRGCFDEDPRLPVCRVERLRVEDASIAPHSQPQHAARSGWTKRLPQWFAGRGILAVNLMSLPGASKTTLLEQTIRDLGTALAIGVIEGDQATETDAARIRAAGCSAVQINTSISALTAVSATCDR
jgi:CobW/HypB/UreG, nucleotide-binding domain